MTPTHSSTTPSTTGTSIPTQTTSISEPVLRPRTLVVELFARALDGDLDAEDDLRELAPFDPVADAANEALVLVDLEFYERTAAEDLPLVPDGLIDRILTAIDDVHRHGVHRPRDATPAMCRPLVADTASRLAAEFGELSPWCGCGQPTLSDRWGGSSGAAPFVEEITSTRTRRGKGEVHT